MEKNVSLNSLIIEFFKIFLTTFEPLDLPPAYVSQKGSTAMSVSVNPLGGKQGNFCFDPFLCGISPFRSLDTTPEEPDPMKPAAIERAKHEQDAGKDHIEQ